MNKFERCATLFLNQTRKDRQAVPQQSHCELYVIAKMLSAMFDASLISYILPANATIGAELKAQIAKFDKFASEKLIPSSLSGPFDHA